MAEHEHRWVPTTITDARGQASPGQRCTGCPMRTFGSGTFAVNADFVIGAQRFNQALIDGVARMGRALGASTKGDES